MLTTNNRIKQALDEFAQKLQQGTRLKQELINEIMTYTYGESTNGKWTWKGATDLIEAAIVKLLLEEPTKSIEELREIQGLVPHHQVRSEEQMQLQQFSTPLELATLVSRAARVNGDDILLEPSAGTGILPAIAINQLGNKPQQIILNEISKSRKELLEQLYPQTKIHSLDGEYINDFLVPIDLKPTVILMNPPFSVSVGRSKRNPDACFKHLRSALLRLQPNGRLVAIVAHWLSPEKQPQYFATLPAQLRLSVFLHGSFYRYHGTTMDTRLLVFDKLPNSIPPIKSYDGGCDVITIAQLITDTLPPRSPHEMNEPHTPTPTLQLAIPLPTPSSTPLLEQPPVELSFLPLFQFAINDGTPTPPTPPTPPTHPTHPTHPTPELVRLQYIPATVQESTITDGVYQPYRASAVEIESAYPHPTPLAESIAMAAIKANYPTVRPLLPKPVIEAGLASHEQLEALLYASEAHARFLDTPWCLDERGQITLANPEHPFRTHHRRGFFVGDGTGCGKGVITALIILTNWCEGRKKAVWVSKNETLIEDARRDWQRLGGNPEQVVPLSKFKQGETISLPEGILFVTYGGLRTPAKENKKSRVQQIIDWVGTDWEGCLNFDESHLLGNCVGEEGERGRTKASAQGLAGTDLINRLPKARVTYLSATGAAKVSSLSYCQRLGLWQTSAFPFKSREQFISSMESSGVAALEIVAQDLKRLGLYLARTLSFDGVKFETISHELTPTQERIWDIYAQAFQYIHQELGNVFIASNIQSQTGKCYNSRAKSNVISAFEGMKQRFFNSLLCAAKAPTLIDNIERDLAAGHACVVQLVSTNEALLERKLADLPTSQDRDLRAVDFTPREGVIDYLMNTFPTKLYRVYQDDKGNSKSELVVDEHGNPVDSQEAIAIRDALIERISLLPPVNGLLDQINWHFGADRVSEVTGRSKRILLKDGKYQLTPRSSSSNIAETTAFQADEKQILVFSQAGGTGRSYHADLNCQNQRLRRHYLVEAGWEAISAVQGFGRSLMTTTI